MTAENRIKKALEIAHDGSYDGGHHKMWVIDQMIRALTGCPMMALPKLDCNGNKYEYKVQGKSDEYKNWIREHCNGEEGEDAYSWDEGIPP